jgi:Arc/MetJ-type ribon-helix-helix transcriptional regulator
MTRQIALRLPEELVDRLDALVAADPSLVSRSAALHQAVAVLVADRERALVDAAIVDGYRRVPPGGVDQWGDPEEAALMAALLNARRLDAEDGGW